MGQVQSIFLKNNVIFEKFSLVGAPDLDMYFTDICKYPLNEMKISSWCRVKFCSKFSYLSKNVITFNIIMWNLHLQNKVLNIKKYNNDCYSSITIIIDRIKTGFCKQRIILCNFKLYNPILHIIT